MTRINHKEHTKNGYARGLIGAKAMFGFHLLGCFQSDSNHRNSSIQET